MLDTEEFINEFKRLTRLTQDKNFTYCQNLNIRSLDFGFRDFYHLQQQFPHLSIKQTQRISSSLMRKLCSIVEPDSQKTYFIFTLNKESLRHLTYHSIWAGDDKHGCEVRVPREVFFSRLEYPFSVYIIENQDQFMAWRSDWWGTAVLSPEIAKKNFLSAFSQEARVVRR